jgi:DNA adenine methylase
MAAKIARIVRRHLSPEGRYIEPFLGGGAVFFHLRPKVALLGDINSELIEVYETVRDRPREVVARLRRHPVDSGTYYRLRATRPRSPMGRAVRFLYLNRTAFGGIYRLNKRGDFNVPFGGRSTAILWERNILHRAADALRGAGIMHCDFANLLRAATVGDVIFCDPTYTVAHDNNGFVRYNERNFSWLDQVRLAKEAMAARTRGATVLISNAHHNSVRQLYAQERVRLFHRPSTVSKAPVGRRSVTEYLFLLHPQLGVQNSGHEVAK